MPGLSKTIPPSNQPASQPGKISKLLGFTSSNFFKSFGLTFFVFLHQSFKYTAYLKILRHLSARPFGVHDDADRNPVPQPRWKRKAKKEAKTKVKKLETKRKEIRKTTYAFNKSFFLCLLTDIFYMFFKSTTATTCSDWAPKVLFKSSFFALCDGQAIGTFVPICDVILSSAQRKDLENSWLHKNVPRRTFLSTERIH